ncbi:MAG: response regulator [Gammaproteobacteria bacterium]|nr:response regulator [Gammaproteobacteria bacterium]MBQ0840756.1 response regulator [Gammaproteobacteria bacterium]
MSIALLIVDDSGFSRKAMLKSLPESWDVEITQATNGEEALEALRKGLGEVVLLDLTMPVLDGFGVLEGIRDEGLQAKVVVVSADIQPKAKLRVITLGALAFLQKPFNKESLAAVLADCEIYRED